MEKVDPTLQFLHIGCDVVRLMGVDRARPFLDKGAGIGVDMLLELVDLYDGIMRTDGIAEPPAGHSVGLAEAIGHNQVISDLGIARHPGLCPPAIDQFLIYFIRDDPCVVLQSQRYQQISLFPGKNLPSWVVRVVE